jgi:SAM-dependent methyltransferase
MPLHTLSTSSVEYCELCHGTAFTPVAAQDRDGQPLRTVICNDCGLVFSNPRPSSTQIDDFYRQSYRLAYKKAWHPRLKHTYRAGRVAQDRLRHLMPLFQPRFSLLDFGSGGGEFVFLLRELGYDARGIEPNIGYAEYSQDVLGIPVQIGGFADAHVQPNSLDFVTLFHVAEHLEHPVEAFKKVAGWLRTGGRFCVEVPNVENCCIWPSSRLHPAHLYNFNAATLAQAGLRAGLQVNSTFTSGDGGNLTAIFEKPRQLAEKTPGPLPGNAQRILRILRDHTTLAHAFTSHPYLRPVQKLHRQWREHSAIYRATDGKTLLRQLAREIEFPHRESSPSPPTAALARTH